MTIRVCVVGATGWTGSAVARGILASDDLELVNAVTRSSAGLDLGVAWGENEIGVPILGDVGSAARLVPCVAHKMIAGTRTTSVAGSPMRARISLQRNALPSKRSKQVKST